MKISMKKEIICENNGVANVKKLSENSIIIWRKLISAITNGNLYNEKKKKKKKKNEEEEK
jgi:hypothetical protein